MTDKQILEQFDEKFFNFNDNPCHCCGGLIEGHWKGGIKAFLASALSQARADEREKVEEEKVREIIQNINTDEMFAEQVKSMILELLTSNK